ncbi:MAG: InlB B-repeat-containing protein [Clostridium sp.]|nr:InlB B-repeat-containing protein [Clostridium sp.]
MSKKGLKTMLVCIVLLIGLVTLFACNKGNVADKDGQTKVIVKIQDEDGSIYKENVVFSDLFTLSLQKEGYTGRLYRDADFLKPLTKDSKVKNGDTVYVKWTINKYTVTFMDGEKVLRAFTNVPHGSAVTAPEVSEKYGKTFIGWDKPFDNVTSDLTINAVYDVDKFTVTFKDGEKVLETQTVEYEAAATAPDTARLSPPEGKHFAKWDKDFSKVTENIEVSAVYELNVYTVIFKNGEMTLTTRVEHGSAATPPNVFDTPTEKFVGWDKPFDNVTSDLIVNAKFETKKFTLTFINFDGTTVYTAEVEYGASISDHFETADSAATYDDTILDYDGWYKADGTEITKLDLPTMPAENFTLTLKLRLMDSAIGDFKVNTPADFTFTESNTAEFSVMPNEGTALHKGVTYKYIWTINKDNVFYKTEETTKSSLTLQNLAAGEYLANVKIVASMENCGSVENDFTADKTLIVSRADISGITVTGVTMTYGDKTAEIGISGLRADDVVTYGTDGTTFPLQNVDLSALDCGEYDYFVRVDRGDNYNPFTSGKITVTINKATVSATVTPKSDKLTYGDNLPSLTAKIGEETYTIESGKYELHFGYTKITGNVANNVGTYNIENVDISVLRAKYPEKNYDIKLTTVGTITINEAKLTVTVLLDKTELTYGEALPIITYKFDGLKLSDTEDDFTITKTEFAEKLDVGTYTASVTLSGEKTKFYNITVNTVEFKVNKRPATITINAVDNIIYGDKVPDLSAKVEVKGVLDGDSLSYTLNPNYEVGNKPGDYTASVVFDENAAENKNYAITATGRTFTVGTKDLTIKLNNTATVAVGKTYKVEAEHLDKIGLVAGDTVTGNVTITKDVAGTYNADDFDKTNLVVKNAGCYVISYEMSVEFIVVTFAIDFADVTLTYDGKPHGVLVTKTDASKHYTITYGTTENDCTLNSSPEYTNEGAYKIYFKVVDNDTLAEEKGSVTLTINKKAVTVKVNDVTITYGGTPKFEYTVAGLVNGETLLGEAVYSGAGTDAGEYDISVSGLTASNNYNVSFVPGKLTINKKTAEVAWTIAENYVYSPDGQTLPTATYDGKTANLIFTKDGKACEFKNAGTYTVTVADDNYILTNNEKTIVINKAKYTAAPALSLSGTYDPNKTLGNYALSEGFTWVNPDEIPVCTKTKYAAKYNMDPANYEDYETTVTLVLQKATVTLAQNLFEFNYDGASHEIGTTVKYNNIEVTEPYTLTFDKKEFSAAGTHKTTATLTADNFALSDNVVYVKVKGVKVGNNYYTIEDALFNSKSGDTVEFISAAKEVSFAPLDIATAIYADNAYRTVKAGVTLKLASDEDSSAKIGKPTYGAGVGNYVDNDSSKIKYKLILNESTVLEVYGNILIQGLLGVNGPGLSGHTSGNHSQIINNGTINLNSGANLDLRGYIKGAGTIEARSGAIVYSPFVVYDYRGGTNTATVYRKGNIAPFRIYEMPNIQCNYSILYGAEHKGYLDLYASDKHRTAVATIFGKGSAMMIMEDSTAHITTTYERTGNLIGETTLTMTGKVKMGVLKIKVTTTVTVAMNEVRFPMPWNFTINVGDGLNPTTFTLPDDYKMMTGATVNVKKSATVNLTGTLLIYKSFTDTPFGGTVYPNKGAAKLNVEGVVNVTGGIAGEIFGSNGGKVVIGNNAILSITEKEGNSGSTTSLQALVGAGEFVTVATISEVAKVVNANNSTITAATNKTYNYNDGTWQ